MVIRIFIPWYVPAHKAGGPVQSVANLVNRLSGDCTFYIVTSNTDVDGTVLNVKADAWISQGLHSRILYVAKGLMNDFFGLTEETIFINGLYSWRFTILPILRAPAKRKIVSVRGMLHPGALSLKSLKKKVYLGAWKIFGLHRRVTFHASTETERAYIQNVFGRDVDVQVAGNFPRILHPQPIGKKQRRVLSLVSLALISPMKNILLVLQALYVLDEEINYHIYGAVKDSGYWQRCEALIKTLPPNINVQYHGDVLPSKVEQALTSGEVFVLPSKSENFGHALYEAMTAGKPVITSCSTPWNGLQEAKAGFNVATENEVELARAIRTFAAMDAHELEVWSRGAVQYAKAAVDLSIIETQYRTLFGLEETPIGPQKISTASSADVENE